MKSGNAHLRRVLVESVWGVPPPAECTGPRAGEDVKRWRSSEEARQIAWKAQQRLYKRYVALTARGKTSGQAMTALARELLGFVWAIAVHTEKQFLRTEGGLSGEFFPDRGVDDSRGAHERENPRRKLCGARSSYPNPRFQSEAAPDGSCHCRFRSAHISVINRRACLSAVFGTPVRESFSFSLCPTLVSVRRGVCQGFTLSRFAPSWTNSSPHPNAPLHLGRKGKTNALRPGISRALTRSLHISFQMASQRNPLPEPRRPPSATPA